jgi:hypothetical protein
MIVGNGAMDSPHNAASAVARKQQSADQHVYAEPCIGATRESAVRRILYYPT